MSGPQPRLSRSSSHSCCAPSITRSAARRAAAREAVSGRQATAAKGWSRGCEQEFPASRRDTSMLEMPRAVSPETLAAAFHTAASGLSGGPAVAPPHSGQGGLMQDRAGELAGPLDVLDPLQLRAVKQRLDLVSLDVGSHLLVRGSRGVGRGGLQGWSEEASVARRVEE